MGDTGGYGEALRRALPPFFSPLEIASRLPTTMVRAAELAEAGVPEGATVVADEQTAGRGRLGRAWLAPPGSALLVSVVLRPPLAIGQAWLVVSLAAVALADTVRQVLAAAGSRATVGLKWPNDLLLDGRKAAGLLAEAGAGGLPSEARAQAPGPPSRAERSPPVNTGGQPGGRLPWVVLGMGVNVGEAMEFPAELAGRATSVGLAAGRGVDRAELLGAWGRRFIAGYGDLGAGPTTPLLLAYRDRLETLGRRVRAERLSGDPVVGTAVDLTASGNLVILTDTGTRVEISTGDVEHLSSEV
jgi:BirA family transcriptional regulator, biotin operon repressor / biotin---[acetyl-CoA-carboxylase] ligase